MKKCKVTGYDFDVKFTIGANGESQEEAMKYILGKLNKFLKDYPHNNLTLVYDNEDFKCPDNEGPCNIGYACDACPFNEKLIEEDTNMSKKIADKLRKAGTLVIPEEEMNNHFKNSLFWNCAEYPDDLKILKHEIGFCPTKNKRLICKEF